MRIIKNANIGADFYPGDIFATRPLAAEENINRNVRIAEATTRNPKQRVPRLRRQRRPDFASTASVSTLFAVPRPPSCLILALGSGT